MAKLYIKNTDGTFAPHSSIAVTKLDVVQSKGNSLTSAMSQKAVTDELANKQNTLTDTDGGYGQRVANLEKEGIASQAKLSELEKGIDDIVNDVRTNLLDNIKWEIGRLIGSGISTDSAYENYRIARVKCNAGDKIIIEASYTPTPAFFGYLNPNGTATILISGTGSSISEQTITCIDATYVVCELSNTIDRLTKWELIQKSRIAKIEQSVESLGLSTDEKFAKIEEDIKKGPYYTFPYVCVTDGAREDVTSLLKSMIKKVEVTNDFVDYQQGCLRVAQLACFSYTEGSSIRIATGLGIIKEDNITLSAAKQINIYSNPTDDIVLDYGNGVKITFDASFIWNYTWEIKPYINIKTTNNPYRIYADGDGNLMGGELIKDGSIEIQKLSQGTKDNFNNSFLSGKVLISLCDSLGATSQWQRRLADKTNAIYSEMLNNGHYSIGGTKTFYANQNGSDAQSRAKMIVSDGTIPDIILIENVNDDSSVPQGTMEDESFFRGKQTIVTSPEFSSKNDADSYWESNFTSIVDSVTPEVGRILGVPYSTSNGIRLKITGSPTANGNIGITLTGLSRKDIAVTIGESISSIVSKILEYDWGGWTDIQDPSDPNSVIFTKESGTSALTIETNSTGLTYTKTEGVQGQLASWRCFKSRDISHWNDSSYWVEKITKYAAWKGLVEYLFSQFPSAYICWIIPQTYSIDYTSSEYKRPDGSVNYEKILAEKMYQVQMLNTQVEFCKYYQLPYIDIRQYGCLTPGNLSTFMNVNNVHPKQNAYNRWADIIAKLM